MFLIIPLKRQKIPRSETFQNLQRNGRDRETCKMLIRSASNWNPLAIRRKTHRRIEPRLPIGRRDSEATPFSQSRTPVTQNLDRGIISLLCPYRSGQKSSIFFFFFFFKSMTANWPVWKDLRTPCRTLGFIRQ